MFLAFCSDFYINVGFFSRFCIVPIMYWIHATAVSCPNCILYYAYEINLEFYRHVALSFWPCLICWPAAAAVWQMSGNTRSWWINEGIVLILDALASAHTQTQAPWVHIFPPPLFIVPPLPLSCCSSVFQQSRRCCVMITSTDRGAELRNT